MFRFKDIFNISDGDDSTTVKVPKGTPQDYNALRQQCLSSGSLFEDAVFAPRNSRGCTWLRPHEISNQPKFISSGATRFDVIQGELGDCWLIAAVANLTLDQKLFALVVPPDQSFDRGQYCGIFRFRFWQFGKWVEVVIDDRLPTRDGKLLFMHSDDTDEFWSPLFEKAYAKIHGSYDALRGGTTCEAMVDLTGGLTEFFDVQTAEAPPNLYQIIKKAFDRGSLIGCSIEAQDESQRENELPNGLIKGHAYSVTAVLDITVQGRSLPMLRLRNPWSGTSEWNGPWSDRSREWSMIDDYQKQRLGLVFENDGEFWISFHDFRKNFTRVELCNLTPDSLDNEKQRHWYAQLFEGSWIRGCTAGGCRNNLNSFAQNPQYVIKLVDPDEDDDEENCTVIVALMQKTKRSAKKYQMGAGELTIGFAIYALQDTGYFEQNPTAYSTQNGQQILTTDFFKYNTSVARSPTYINLREVTARFSLPPGVYAIVPSTFDKGEEGEFILRVWTEAPVSGREPPPSNYPDRLPVAPEPAPRQPSPAPEPRRPSPQPGPQIPEPTPSYPRFPTPSPQPSPKPSDPSPAYPPYPTKPSMPGYPPYPTNPGANYPTYPAYPAYPSLPRDGGDIRYPTIPDEPSIRRRKVIPPPPGPSIDISIGEVIGHVSTIISILTMCYNTYQSLKSHSAQTYPYGGGGGGGGGGNRQFAAPPGNSGYQEPFARATGGYALQSSNKTHQTTTQGDVITTVTRQIIQSSSRAQTTKNQSSRL